MKTFCYHGRDLKGTKLFGGMLHAESWDDAAERATAGHSVKLSTFSGNWVNKDGKEVYIYLSVMPDQTKRGQTLLADARKKRDEQEREECKKQEAIQAEIDEKMAGLSDEEILRRLS